MSKLSHEFFRQIGAKGGRAGRWSLAKRESARRAAHARWSKYRQAQRAIAEYQKDKW